jgi:geranylgeranyl diphosphate synthase type II
LAEVGSPIEAALDEVLPAESEKPRSVHRAMRYSVLSGGKRIRPALAALGFRLGGGRGDGGVRLGAAIELIHTFSLIHDDLPCMDDDDYRRGRLTCHRKFGEAVAVLAGDGLQVLAFEALATLPAPAERRLRVLREITRAVGTAGVVGGQVVDIESEGRRISPASLRWMHERKTGALLRASLVCGAILAGGRPRLVERLAGFGAAFGLLFQITDDLLDEHGSYRTLGRRRGRDRVLGKATYPAILGRERARLALAEAVAGTLSLIPVEGAVGEIFADLVGTVVGRLPDGILEGTQP